MIKTKLAINCGCVASNNLIISKQLYQFEKKIILLKMCKNIWYSNYGVLKV